MTNTRGSYMGISCGPTASIKELDATKELGLGWVRVSHEMGWTNTIPLLAQTVKDAHSRGLKVLQCIQKSGHTYTGSDVKALKAFALQCADTGVDALEIFNEANNAAFFKPLVTPPILTTSLSIAIAQAVRAKYPTLPISTTGLSPAALPYAPHTYWPAFWDASPAGNKVAGYTVAAAIHPFVYPEDPCTMMSHPEWNPWAGLQIIRDAMTARKVNSPVWFTEVGCPGTNTNPPVIRGIALTEDRQNFVTSQYLKQYKTLGKPGELLMIATMFDGESVSVPGPENYLGLKRADGTKKPAWSTVQAYAKEVI